MKRPLIEVFNYFDYTIEYERGIYHAYPVSARVDNCIYCGFQLFIVFKFSYVDAYYHEDWYSEGKYCKNCGWWICNNLGERSFYSGHQSFLGILKKSIKETDKITQGLVELNNNKSIALNVRPYELEKYAKSLLSDFFCCDVTHVGKSHDGGIDLLVVHSDEGIIPVQVKRRRDNNRTEGVSSIREFRGAMVLKGFSKGVFLTTARKYSNEAIKAANPTPEHLINQKIVLLDCRRLVEVLELMESRKSQMKMLFSCKPEMDDPNFISAKRSLSEFNSKIEAGLVHNNTIPLSRLPDSARDS